MRVFCVFKEDGNDNTVLEGIFPTLYSARCFFIEHYDCFPMTVTCWKVGGKALWTKQVIGQEERENQIKSIKRIQEEFPERTWEGVLEYWENIENFLLVRGKDIILTLEEIEQCLQEETMKRLKTTPLNFKKAWEEGLYDHGDVCDLLGQAFLLPKDHPWHIDLMGDK